MKKKKENAPTVDVLSHNLMPQMKVLGASEKNKILSEFSINSSQLPKFYSTDPAVLALKAQAGDVIKIERNDGTSKYTAYRVVIE
ncbi:DNA-directed RNA polymerase subunit H [Candidatus Micrarchaeota archaeon]|nr:DNA-directed RNA polymerase subunit H [Candidatus Micrarchaeota archaeon]